MKKELLLALGIFLGPSIHSQDWQLFTKDQLSYYKQHYDNKTVQVESFLSDSTYVKDGKKTFLFNSKSKISERCYSKFRSDFMSFDHWLNNPQKIDSLILSNDSLFFITDYTFEVDTFIFKPYSNVGDAWYTKSIIVDSRGSRDTNFIIIECTEKKAIDIFGIQDSVKIFKCRGNPYDTIEFVLSKSYGFIKFLPLNEFIWHYADLSLEPYFELIGYSNLRTSKGYTQPDFSEYFHLSAGDILFWSDISNPADPRIPKSTSHHVDSITVSYISSDSVYYEYKRTDYSENGSISHVGNYSTFHLRKDEGLILQNNTSWYGLKYDRYWPSEIFFFESLYLKIENTDTITYAQYKLPGIFIDTSDCEIHTAADYDMTVGFSTREGKIFQGTFSWGESSTSIIGSIINGNKYGETDIPTGIQETNFENFKVFPNPFLDHITIDSPNNIVSLIEIYDIKGNLIIKFGTNKDTIDLGKLLSGIYILRITDSRNNTRNIKIIKL